MKEIFHTFVSSTSNVPDSIKVTAAVSAPALTVLGIDVEQWTFILAGIVSMLFIVEKIPMLVQRISELWGWVKSVSKRKKT